MVGRICCIFIAVIKIIFVCCAKERMIIFVNQYNAIKVFHHANALDALSAHEQKALFYIRLKPMNLCNHNCAYCTYGSGDTEQKTSNRLDVMTVLGL